MNTRTVTRIPLVSLLGLAALAFAGCHHPKPVAVAKPEATPAPTVTPAGDEAVRKGLPSPDATAKLETVYFAFDRWELDSAAKATLSHDADLLKTDGALPVTIEGHADERGTTQYNLALGERRASAVKTYLSALGVPATRLKTVSYGNERPADPGHDEAAWSKNRRAEIVVSGSTRVSSSY